MESNEDEFKDISEQIEQLNRRIAAIQDSLANDMSRQERLEQIQKVIEQREQNSDQYDDSIVRQMIVSHTDAAETLLGVAAVAGIFAVKKYLQARENAA